MPEVWQQEVSACALSLLRMHQQQRNRPSREQLPMNQVDKPSETLYSPPMNPVTYEVLDLNYVITSDGVLRLDDSVVTTIEDALTRGLIKIAEDPSIKRLFGVKAALKFINDLPPERVAALVIGVIYTDAENRLLAASSMVGSDVDVMSTIQNVSRDFQETFSAGPSLH